MIHNIVHAHYGLPKFVICTGHRALADVEVLEEILNFPELADVPLALPKKPASAVIESMTRQD